MPDIKPDNIIPVATPTAPITETPPEHVFIRVQLTEEQVEAQFAALVERLSTQIHGQAVKNGFWDAPNPGEKLALTHSELSEALEYWRKDASAPDDKIPVFTGVEAELADAVIRLFDLAKHYKLRLGEAIIAKHKFNKTRPFKHGKKF